LPDPKPEQPPRELPPLEPEELPPRQQPDEIPPPDERPEGNLRAASIVVTEMNALERRFRMSRFNRYGAALFGLTLALAPIGLAADEVTSGPSGGRANSGAESTAETPARATNGKDRVFIIDAPDLRKVGKDLAGPRFKTLIGQEVYSNSGKKIGKIEDFVMADRGEMYAVIDTSDGPIEKLVKMGDSEMLILPLRELRKAALPASKSQ
jgi:sporulation protein YlmC with PRC-barrel domain